MQGQLPRRNAGRIAGYVTKVTTQETGKKTSNTGGLFIASCQNVIFVIFNPPNQLPHT